MRTRRTRAASPVDALDARIIRLLQGDGRLANTEIARRLGVAEATVRNRIERLLQERVIQVGAWADPLKIGYQTYAMIEIQVKPPYIVKVAERLAQMPEFYFVGICTGAFDIYAGAVVRSVDDMYELTTRRLAHVPGIVRTSTSNVIRLVKRDYSYPIPDFEAEAPGAMPPRGARRRRPPRSRDAGRTRPAAGAAPPASP
jgi:Lrp/AsnC family transcriptional regulator for asnA, asnC and gidA